MPLQKENRKGQGKGTPLGKGRKGSISFGEKYGEEIQGLTRANCLLSLIWSASTERLWNRCGCMWLHMWGNHQNSFTYDSSRSSPASSASVPIAQAQAAQPSPPASRPRDGRGRPLPTQKFLKAVLRATGQHRQSPSPGPGTMWP